MKRITAALSAVATLAIVVPLPSQPLLLKPAFEVTSVKPNTSRSNDSRTSCCDGGYFKATNATLRGLILSYYKLLEFQLVGAPDWISTARFDIEARTATPVTPKSGDSIAMVQSLIEDRFQLKTHHETRDLPVFMLVVAKSGAKLQKSIEGRPGPGGMAVGSARSSGTPQGVELSGSGITIDRLISMLTSRVGRPIIDKTDLTEKYDFTLKFAPSAVTTAATGDPIGPDVFTAIQEQLGLRLEAGKGPVEVTVIDSVQKPTAN